MAKCSLNCSSRLASVAKRDEQLIHRIFEVNVEHYFAVVIHKSLFMPIDIDLYFVSKIPIVQYLRIRAISVKPEYEGLENFIKVK